MDDARNPPNPRIAAVLVPVHFDNQGELHLTVIRRSPGGVHGGQIAFPGGKFESDDPDYCFTALREAEEEIGLAMDRVQVLKALTPVETISNFTVYPFLGLIKPPMTWVIAEDEVAEVLTVSFTTLIQSHGVGEVDSPVWTRPRLATRYLIQGWPLWGASYRIFQPVVRDYLSGRLLRSGRET